MRGNLLPPHGLLFPKSSKGTSICTIPVLFNDAVNTFLIQLYCIGHMVKDQEGRKEGNILFNDAVNTFLIQLYGVCHTVKDNS